VFDVFINGKFVFFGRFGHRSPRFVVVRLSARSVGAGKPPKRRLADEYDAAQERGEVATGLGQDRHRSVGNDVRPATAAEIGFPAKRFTKPADTRRGKDVTRASFGRLALVLSIMVANQRAAAAPTSG